MRDLETAQIAIQASLTGHLVLSTLHTNDAPGAVTRLVDMGVGAIPDLFHADGACWPNAWSARSARIAARRSSRPSNQLAIAEPFTA
ncbi:MAG: ATPase, T2SS/T4P/T4SS family [Verrucomicrobiota bacterium]